MANIKISELPQASVLSQNSVLPIVSGSTTYKVNLEDLNVIEKTKAQIDTLVGSNSLIPGQLYKITGVDTALYGGTDILIKAATTSELELAGHGIFYNPKYLNSQLTPNNGYGIWSNYITLTMSSIVGTFTNGDTVTANNGATATYLAQNFLSWISGDWSAATSISNGAGATANVTEGVSPSYAIGDDVIWGGKHWTNTSGAVGTATNKYTLSAADWTVVAFNSTDYNVVADVIHYDYEHDMIVRRKDKWNNDVDGNFQVFDEFANPDAYDYGNPIKDFQWGNGPEDWNTNDYQYMGVQSNYIKDSYLECINFMGKSLWVNKLTQQSYIWNNIVNVGITIINNNTLTNASYMINNTIINGYIYSNTLTYGRIEQNILTDSNIIYNTLTNGSIQFNTLTANGNINYNTLTASSNISNNLLTTNSNIVYNVLNNSSGILYNTLTTNCNIYNNALVNSSINDNTLTNNSSISDNTLMHNSNIYGNTLTINSGIYENTLMKAIIDENILFASSTINNNTLTNDTEIFFNTLNFFSYIYYNILNSVSIIEDNTLSNSYIYSNTLTNNSIIVSNIFNYSSIEYNTLNNFSTFNFSSSGTLSNKGISKIEASFADATFNISAATIIFTGFYSKQMFKNSAGTTRLGYYNTLDVFTVVNVNS